MRKSLLGIPTLLFMISFGKPNEERKPNPEKAVFLVHGSMPAKPIETAYGISLIYGIGDSLMQASGSVANGMQEPRLIAVVPKMFSHAMRGPQAALTNTGAVTIVCTEDGNILCYKEDRQHVWKQTAQLNKPGSAKEGLASLAADGNNLVAVWLNARNPKGQSIYCGVSVDGGDTWKAREIYSSPDGTTCECCKPTVAMKGKTAYVMFRNWLNGNRDMHIMKSSDAGLSFSTPEKLGTGNWKLNGCPMDGGDIQIDSRNEPMAIWRREGKLYSSLGTGNETLLAEGKNGSVSVSGNGNAYAWTDKGSVIVQTFEGNKHVVGEGSLPILTTLKDGSLFCIWQKEKSILGSVIKPS